jgi:hypothetical protein
MIRRATWYRHPSTLSSYCHTTDTRCGSRIEHTSVIVGQDQICLNEDRAQTIAGLGVRWQGCSTLWNGQDFKQVIDARQSGAVAVLAEGADLACLEDVEGEAAETSKHARVATDT